MLLLGAGPWALLPFLIPVILKLDFIDMEYTDIFMIFVVVVQTKEMIENILRDSEEKLRETNMAFYKEHVGSENVHRTATSRKAIWGPQASV